METKDEVMKSLTLRMAGLVEFMHLHGFPKSFVNVMFMTENEIKAFDALCNEYGVE